MTSTTNERHVQRKRRRAQLWRDYLLLGNKAEVARRHDLSRARGAHLIDRAEQQVLEELNRLHTFPANEVLREQLLGVEISYDIDRFGSTRLLRWRSVKLHLPRFSLDKSKPL